MKNTKELQEEFELLIEELGRLKSINDITFENSNNSKRTIDAIESLVAAMETFKKRVESDYKAKSDELMQLQNSFKDVIGSLQSNVDEQTIRFESIVNKFTESSNKSKEEFQKKTNQKLNDFTEQSISAFDKQQLSIEKSADLINAELSKMRRVIDISNSNLRQIHENSSKEMEKQLSLMNSQLNAVQKKHSVLSTILIVTMILIAVSIGISFIL